jgi:ABC-type transporter Mla subunit MlaD
MLISCHFFAENSKLVEKLQQINQSTKETLQERYQQLSDNGHDAEKHLQNLNQSFKDAFNKLGDNSSETYKNAMNKVDQFSGKSQEEYKKFYEEMSHNLDSVYNESVDKIKHYFTFEGKDGTAKAN